MRYRMSSFLQKINIRLRATFFLVIAACVTCVTEWVTALRSLRSRHSWLKGKRYDILLLPSEKVLHNQTWAPRSPVCLLSPCNDSLKRTTLEAEAGKRGTETQLHWQWVEACELQVNSGLIIIRQASEGPACYQWEGLMRPNSIFPRVQPRCVHVSKKDLLKFCWSVGICTRVHPQIRCINSGKQAW